MGKWKGSDIPLDEFDGVGKTKVDKSEGYDFLADLSSFKADITFGQLLEKSSMAHKNLKERMPVSKRTRKVKTRVAARIELQGCGRDVKAIEIEVIVVSNVLVDGDSGLNILSEHNMKRLGPSLTGPSPFIINMASQSLAVP
jgi:hypothetical protein